ncbi:hypothetical protein [Rothia sp. 11254D007CT]
MKSLRSIAVTATAIALLALNNVLLSSPALASEQSAQTEYTTAHSAQPMFICQLLNNKPRFCK